MKADFSVEIFDWNQIEAAKSLGSAKIDITDIEPFEATERTLNLTSAKHGEKGQVLIRMVFTPEIIAKARKSTSTFNTAGRAMTQFGGLPVAAGKGVLHGVAGVFRKEHHERETLPDIPSGQASRPVGPPDHLEARNVAFPKSSTDGSPQEPGTLQVTVVNAKDLSSSDGKPYVTIRVGDKEVKTKHTGKTGHPEWCVMFMMLCDWDLTLFLGTKHSNFKPEHPPRNCLHGSMIIKRLVETGSWGKVKLMWVLSSSLIQCPY